MIKLTDYYLVILILCGNILFFSDPICAQNFSASTENPVITGIRNQKIEKFEPFIPEKIGEMERIGIMPIYGGVQAEYAQGKYFSEAILMVTAPPKFSMGVNDSKLSFEITASDEGQPEKRLMGNFVIPFSHQKIK